MERIKCYAEEGNEDWNECEEVNHSHEVHRLEKKRILLKEYPKKSVKCVLWPFGRV